MTAEDTGREVMRLLERMTDDDAPPGLFEEIVRTVQSAVSVSNYSDDMFLGYLLGSIHAIGLCLVEGEGQAAVNISAMLRGLLRDTAHSQDVEKMRQAYQGRSGLSKK